MHIIQTPAYRKAFRSFLRSGVSPHLLLPGLLRKAAEEHPTAHYIWRTSGDAKVRPEHAANEGKVFAWDNPPPTGHPGEAYGCRCTAEPYRGNESEYAKQTILSLAQDSPKWSLLDFGLHYYLGGGKLVTLQEIGHLSGIINHYFYNIVRNGVNTYNRINSQIISVARAQGLGTFSYDFKNSYDEFGDYLWIFGGGMVSGVATGQVRQENGMLLIRGYVDYRYSDTFTDIFNIREGLIDSSEPLNASLAGLFVSDLGGVFFDIVGTWQTEFSAEVGIEAKESIYQ